MILNLNQLLKNDGVNNLIEKEVVFPKVQCTTNHIFVMKGLDKTETKDLNNIIRTANLKLCEIIYGMLLLTINNGSEAIDLSEKTSWMDKDKYITRHLIVEIRNSDVQITKPMSKQKSELSDQKGKAKLFDLDANIKKTKKEFD